MQQLGRTVDARDQARPVVDKLLADANISEEDRQRILTNSVCPCCGSAASLTVKLGD